MICSSRFPLGIDLAIRAASHIKKINQIATIGVLERQDSTFLNNPTYKPVENIVYFT